MPNRAPAAGVTVITGGWCVAKKKRNIPGTYIGHHLPWRKKKGKKRKTKKEVPSTGIELANFDWVV